MKILLKICLPGILLLLFLPALPQNSYVSRGDTEFSLKNYAKAISYYKNAVAGGKSKWEVSDVYKKLGDCYRLLNQPESAVGAYKMYIDAVQVCDKGTLYNYGNSLLKAGKIAEARTEFSKMLSQYPDDEEVKRMISCCDFAKLQLSLTNKKPVQNQNLINSNESEFGLAFFGDNLIFASQRLNDEYSAIDGRTSQGYSDFFMAKFNPVNKMYSNPVRLQGEINSPYNDGTFSYLERLNTAYFTQC